MSSNSSRRSETPSSGGRKRRRAVGSEEEEEEREAGDERSARGETMDYEEEEREESVGPSRLRGGAGEGGAGRKSDKEMEGESSRVAFSSPSLFQLTFRTLSSSRRLT